MRLQDETALSLSEDETAVSLSEETGAIPRVQSALIRVSCECPSPRLLLRFFCGPVRGKFGSMGFPSQEITLPELFFEDSTLTLIFLK